MVFSLLFDERASARLAQTRHEVEGALYHVKEDIRLDRTFLPDGKNPLSATAADSGRHLQ